MSVRSVAAGEMSTWAMFTTAPDEEEERKQHDHDEGDDSEHLYPAWGAGG